ncbi:acetyltransferase [Deinococcus radiopugnans]|uniref:Acetyltransferase n=2 Tax=Deinococcus radiopugnans TaxID=57497 RepID=A0A0A7KGE1_9DEIO|nr:GNAT family N-acetyltransferase [Deinococcus radiopugnans]AIZ45237.1 acetyltransferase [Deinococcus radiopugnans]MBB6016891.1 phosphinothricin acetyltransferase [Deinococcus radiopugnans ATCC 19172]QLG10615.1 N-acetyltransferase family protein [Deinococcus sp. D7000]TNM71835.1 N-acetyltransferase family protein [Deinococcus radiopugnans ATCC 19172]
MTPSRVRPATRADVPALLEIYNHAVLHTTASYDLEAVSLDTRLAWFDHKQAAGWPVLVLEESGEVLGWATYGPFREKPGYAQTVEHSVYIREGRRGAGLGRRLMLALIADARARGFHVMLGGVDADNVGSLAFHARLGFVQVARFRQVGRKFGRWLDLAFVQLLLGGEGVEVPPGSPPESDAQVTGGRTFLTGGS